VIQVQLFQVLCYSKFTYSKKMSSLSTAFGLSTMLSSDPILCRPAEMMPLVCAQQTLQNADDDYELQMKDIGDKIWRFRGEKRGRCYASCWPYDLETDVWRKVFDSYPDAVKNGEVAPAEDHHSGVFWRDIKAVRKEIDAKTCERLDDSLPCSNTESTTN
jgi:hypothetical protein